MIIAIKQITLQRDTTPSSYYITYNANIAESVWQIFYHLIQSFPFYLIVLYLFCSYIIFSITLPWIQVVHFLGFCKVHRQSYVTCLVQVWLTWQKSFSEKKRINFKTYTFTQPGSKDFSYHSIQITLKAI